MDILNDGITVSQMETTLKETIRDDAGRPHVYFSRALPSGVSIPLGMRVLKVVLKALGSGDTTIDVGSIFQQAMAAKGSAEEKMAVLLKSKTVNLGAIARALDEALDVLIENPKMVRQLLSCTNRDGVSLETDGAFDAAYGANLGELVLACRHSVKLNFMGFLKGRLGLSLL